MSIVFALLLMRGGVLTIAPVVDWIGRRKVHWYLWGSLGLSLVALVIAFSEAGHFVPSTIAVTVNLAAYLAGYLFRLGYMTAHAKCDEVAVIRRFFVEEDALTAMVALVAFQAICAIVGAGPAMLETRRGVTELLGSSRVVPAMLVGSCYACLGLFGSLIYLDGRENTFCIPVNRAASLLAGVVASFALMRLAGQPPASRGHTLGRGDHPGRDGPAFGAGSLHAQSIPGACWRAAATAVVRLQWATPAGPQWPRRSAPRRSRAGSGFRSTRWTGRQCER